MGYMDVMFAPNQLASAHSVLEVLSQDTSFSCFKMDRTFYISCTIYSRQVIQTTFDRRFCCQNLFQTDLFNYNVCGPNKRSHYLVVHVSGGSKTGS